MFLEKEGGRVRSFIWKLKLILQDPSYLEFPLHWSVMNAWLDRLFWFWLFKLIRFSITFFFGVFLLPFIPKRIQERLLSLQLFHPCLLIAHHYISAQFQTVNAFGRMFPVKKLCFPPVLFCRIFGISQGDTVVLRRLLVTLLHVQAVLWASVWPQIQAAGTGPRDLTSPIQKTSRL